MVSVNCLTFRVVINIDDTGVIGAMDYLAL